MIGIPAFDPKVICQISGVADDCFMVFALSAFSDPGLEVGEIDAKAFESHGVSGPVQFLIRGARDLQEMAGVRPSQRCGNGFGQLLGGVYLYRSQQRIAAAAEALLARQQVAFVQGQQKLASIRYAAEHLDIFGKESAGEHGKLWQGGFGVAGEQIERVVETGAHALVSAGRAESSAFQQIQPITKPGFDFRQRPAVHPGSGQLDRQRNAVDQTQNLGDRGGVGGGARIPVEDPGAGALAEQREGVAPNQRAGIGRGRGGGHRRRPIKPFAVDVQRCLRGQQKLRLRPAEVQRSQERRGRGDSFEIVQHNEHLPVPVGSSAAPRSRR